MKNLEIIGNQLIETIAYGDALGLSVESRKREEILRDLGGFVVLQELCGHRDFGGEPGGVWSDDTQLSMAVAESLTRFRGFDLEDQANTHISYMDQTPKVERDGRELPRGWGGSTVKSIDRLMQGYTPDISGEFEGAGNGVLMKLAPLVFWHHAQNDEQPYTDHDIVDLTRMTHDAGEAVVASLVHAGVLLKILNAAPRMRYAKRLELAKFAHERAEYYESVYDPERKVVSKHLEKLFADNDLTPEKIVKMAPNGGFYAPETLAMVYGSFILESTFPASVQRTVELGGDTDTTSAIIAPMSLFDAGEVAFPTDAERLQDIDRLRRVSSQFTNIALKGN